MSSRLCCLAQVGAFGDPGRDPRGWTVSAVPVQSFTLTDCYCHRDACCLKHQRCQSCSLQCQQLCFVCCSCLQFLPTISTCSSVCEGDGRICGCGAKHRSWCKGCGMCTRLTCLAFHVVRRVNTLLCLNLHELVHIGVLTSASASMCTAGRCCECSMV